MQPGETLIRGAIIALMIVSLPTLAFAQQRRGPDLDATMVELTEQLELDEGQASQIREFLAAQQEEARKMIEEARASGQGRSAMSGMRERMMGMRESTDTAIKAILSAEQTVKYEEMLATRTAERRERQAAQGGSKRPVT
ncbi:MAG: hypothetical protein V3S56_02795 [Gemmatimonadota bacterium]